MASHKNSQNQQQLLKQSLYKGQIEASNEFQIANIEKNNSNHPSMHITQNDNEKRERKMKFMKEVQNQKSNLQNMLKENIELYKVHKDKSYFGKKSEKLDQQLYCQKDLIIQINQLEAKQKLIIQKAEDMSQNMQYIDSINKISIEHKNLQGFLNQVQLENKNSLYLQSKKQY